MWPSLILLCIISTTLSRKMLYPQPVKDEFFDKLLNGYKYMESPASKENVLITSLSLFLYHLSIPNVPNPVVRFNAFVKFQWQDPRIGWNPMEHGGKEDAFLPYGYKIWTPKVTQVNRVYNIERLAEKNRRSRIYLKVFSKEHYEKAFITQRYQQTGTFDCDIIGSFPSETLNCTTAFLLGAPSTYERFRLHNNNIFMKNLDMGDGDQLQLNGWEIVSATQKKMLYNWINGTAVYGEEGDPNFRSLVVANLIVKRAGWSLPIVIYTPFIVIGFLVSAAWLTSPSYSIAILCSVVYILTVFVKDSISRIPAYTDNFRGLDAAVVFLWISCGFSVLIHLILSSFPIIPQKGAVLLSPLFKLWPLFVKVETRLLDNKKPERLPLQIEFVRANVGALILLSFLVILML